MLEFLLSLKERLEILALASVDLIAQDSKLKATLGQLEQLQSKSPIFAKLYNDINNLYTSDNKALELLDAINLVNAVILTQIKTIENNELTIPDVYESKHINISNKMLRVFNESVFEKGPGRLNALETILEDRNFINDSRIFRGLIYALNDSYSEIPDFCVNCLSTLDADFGEYIISIFDEQKLSTQERLIRLLNNVSNNRETGMYDEFIINLLKNTKDNAKNNGLLTRLISTISTKESNLELIKQSIGSTYASACLHDLYVTGIKDNHNHINDIELTNNFSDYSAYFLYNTTEKLANEMLNEFVNRFNKPKEELILDPKGNLYLLTNIFVTLNKPTDLTFELLLKLYNNEIDMHISKKNSQPLEYYLNELFVQYILLNHNNLNQDFVDKVFSISKDAKSIGTFIIDLLNMSSKEVYDKHGKSFTSKQNSLNSLFIYTLMQLQSTDNGYIFRPFFYAAKERICVHHTFAIKDVLDDRWFKHIVDIHVPIVSSHEDYLFRVLYRGKTIGMRSNYISPSNYLTNLFDLIPGNQDDLVDVMAKRFIKDKDFNGCLYHTVRYSHYGRIKLSEFLIKVRDRTDELSKK